MWFKLLRCSVTKGRTRGRMRAWTGARHRYVRGRLQECQPPKGVVGDGRSHVGNLPADFSRDDEHGGGKGVAGRFPCRTIASRIHLCRIMFTESLGEDYPRIRVSPRTRALQVLIKAR
jgi:hypothetical protein